MSSGTIVAVVVVVIIVVALLAFAPAALRRRRLQQRFGPEYDRAVADAGSRREAETELAEREKRVKEPRHPAAGRGHAEPLRPPVERHPGAVRRRSR